MMKNKFLHLFLSCIDSTQSDFGCDGMYRNAADSIVKAGTGTFYSTFSLWDTYRAAHPLFTYTEPQRVNDMVKSFIAFYEQNGRCRYGIFGEVKRI